MVGVACCDHGNELIITGVKETNFGFCGGWIERLSFKVVVDVLWISRKLIFIFINFRSFAVRTNKKTGKSEKDCMPSTIKEAGKQIRKHDCAHSHSSSSHNAKAWHARMGWHARKKLISGLVNRFTTSERSGGAFCSVLSVGEHPSEE